MNSIYINEIIKKETLSSKAVAVLHNLALHSNKDNECFPALKTISRECHLSVRTVQRALDELLSIGLITKKHNYRSNGSQTSNIYKIIVAVAERAAAIESNAILKLRDMKKRLEAVEAKKLQAAITLQPAEKIEKDSRGQLSSKFVSQLFNKITMALKNTNLTIPPSQID